MNESTASGKFDQVTGKIKQSIGETIGNEKLANAGAADQVKGHAKEAWGETKDATAVVSAHAKADAAVKHEEMKEHAHQTAHDVREKITSAAERLKNSITGKAEEVRLEHEQKRSA